MGRNGILWINLERGWGFVGTDRILLRRVHVKYLDDSSKFSS